MERIVFSDVWHTSGGRVVQGDSNNGRLPVAVRNGPIGLGTFSGHFPPHLYGRRVGKHRQFFFSGLYKPPGGYPPSAAAQIGSAVGWLGQGTVPVSPISPCSGHSE